MTSSGRKDVTSAEALAIHRRAQADAQTDPEKKLRHDEISCWCCCFDCDFDHSATIANDLALGVKSVF